jgi:hypothetical protein
VQGVLVAKLKLLCERVIQPLATLKLLSGEEMDSPLLRLMFLPGQWVIEGLEGSGWMGKFISGEVGVSI